MKGVLFLKRGILIVLEGLDGCGKTTQINLLQERLTKADGRNTRYISFPNYDSPSGEIIKAYLSGKYKDSDGHSAYSASTFYAVDRYTSFTSDWRENYEKGDIIISGRYVGSNAIYQMTKLDKSEWDSYIKWLEELEYEKLGLPKPDRVIFLDMPVEVSQKMLSARYNGDETKKDIHEANVNFMKKCRETALYIAKLKNWAVIECSDGEKPLPIEEIYRMIEKETEKVF